MLIPPDVQFCLSRLENAGYQAYLVGGCVRDSLLGLPPQDFDLCTDALPEQTEAVFSDCRLILAGKKHGTVAVITPGGPIEITTFRTEGDYQDNRHPQWVHFVPDVAQDLARRDYTINAMAYSPTRGFADPFGGREDLKHHILRSVGDPVTRFTEDSLRILRGLRFAAKYHLQIDPATFQAMHHCRNLMDNLARERVFDELCKLILCATADDLCRDAPILAAAIAQLEPMIGFDQRNPHHAYDLFTHTACVTGAMPQNLALRWAALLHDTGKIATFTLDAQGIGHFYGHAAESARIADTILRRLKAPNVLREQVITLVNLHMTPIPAERKAVRRQLSKLGMPMLDALLTLQAADLGGKGKQEDLSPFAQVRELAAQLQAEDACVHVHDLAVNGHDLMALGFTGREIGECLQLLLSRVIDETIPNEKQPLLAAALKLRSKGL